MMPRSNQGRIQALKYNIFSKKLGKQKQRKFRERGNPKTEKEKENGEGRSLDPAKLTSPAAAVVVDDAEDMNDVASGGRCD